MKKVLNIDVLRAMALLLVIVYHVWVLSGSWYIIEPINTYVVLGGEIGVTTFFLLSGYGIFFSLSNMDEKNNIGFKNFFYKRIKRIIPEYYLTLILCLFITSQAQYLVKENILNILSHFLFVHNIREEWFGAINGVLWTMAVIVQFYVVAIPLYYCIKNKPIFTFISSVLFTVLMKYYIFTEFMSVIGMNNTSNFFMGRQLFTSLDNFVVGMFVAYIVKNGIFYTKQRYLAAMSVFSIVSIYYVCQIGFKYGIHTSNISGATWHSILAVSLGILMYGLSYLRLNENNFLYKKFLWLAKYKYGIYLWHLVVIRTLMEYSGIVKNMMSDGTHLLMIVVLTTISVFIGYVMSKIKLE